MTEPTEPQLDEAQVHVCKEQVYMGEAAQYRGALDRIRALWPHIEISRPKHFTDHSVYDPGAPTCLRCKIEEAIGQQPTPTDDCLTCGYAAWGRRMWESNGAPFCAVCEARQEKHDALIAEKAALARSERAEAERDECFEIAAKALGSDYRNVGVVQALAGWVERLRAERDALREEWDAALEDAKAANEDHHKLGRWPNCQRCTSFFVQDENQGLENERLRERVRALEEAEREALRILEDGPEHFRLLNGPARFKLRAALGEPKKP